MSIGVQTNACSLEIFVFSLEKAFIFMLTSEHNVLTCLSNFNFRGGSREKPGQCSTKGSWAWLYGCGKYLRTLNTITIDFKFDIPDFSKEAIKHVIHLVLFFEFIKRLKPGADLENILTTILMGVAFK